jgi:hypothetical protein
VGLPPPSWLLDPWESPWRWVPCPLQLVLEWLVFVEGWVLLISVGSGAVKKGLDLTWEEVEDSDA